MNTNYREIIASKDYSNRIIFLDHTGMVAELAEISEANGEELTFSNFDIADSKDALYIISRNSTGESRFFCSADYFNADPAAAACDAYLFAYDERIDI